MNEVYVVTLDNNDQGRAWNGIAEISGVFSTREKAQEWIGSRHPWANRPYSIHGWPLDDPVPC